MRRSNKKMQAAAAAIETLCIFALADTAGTIRMLLNAFPGVHRLVDAQTMHTLTEGLGYQFEPEDESP